MSVIGKKLNAIPSTLGDDNNKQSMKVITPDDVLCLTKIADDYLCSAGKGKKKSIVKKNEIE